MLLLYTFLGVFTFAQDAPLVVHPEIRGIVVDESNLPVQDVEISAAFQENASPNGKTAAELTSGAISTKSDASGNFTFPLEKLGAYLVWAKKSGYVVMTGSGRFTLTASAPVKAIRFTLGPDDTRTSTITGHVFDDETGKPLANFPVAAVQLSRLPGRYLSFRFPGATDVEGKFVISKLPPNDYLVEISPRASGKERILTSFTEDDIQVTGKDWQHSFWPGGHSEDMASPVALPASATIDVGRLTAHQAPYYRVHLRMPPASCGPADIVTLTEYFESFQVESRHEKLGEVPCGRDVLLTDMLPACIEWCCPPMAIPRRA